MATLSRRMAQKVRPSRPSQTPGKLKAESCQRSELKDFGRFNNPYKLNAAGLDRYAQYIRVVDGMKNNK